MPTARARLGRKAEILAAAELGRRGYRILGANYRCKAGEIDLIAQEGGYLVFVEVRCRRTQDYGTPAESVTAAKQQKLIAAAETYLREHDLREINCRFDVVEVTPRHGRLAADVITNAFPA